MFHSINNYSHEEHLRRMYLHDFLKKENNNSNNNNNNKKRIQIQIYYYFLK